MEPKALAPQSIVLALAVAHVADDRMRDVLEVAADLMQTSGFRTRLDERVSTRRLGADRVGQRRHHTANDQHGADGPFRSALRPAQLGDGPHAEVGLPADRRHGRRRVLRSAVHGDALTHA